MFGKTGIAHLFGRSANQKATRYMKKKYGKNLSYNDKQTREFYKKRKSY